MKKHLLISAIAIAALFILGYGVSAFAEMGRGYGRGDCGGRGGQWGGGGYGASSLSAEQQKQMDEQRRSFFNDTAGIRQELYRKDLDLRRELAMAEPDAAKARLIRKEMSQLEADLEQKRIDHMMTMRQISPELGQGYGYGHGGRGAGYGSCPGMGGGPRGW